MEAMWEHRAPPHALSWMGLTSNVPAVEEEKSVAGIKDQRALSLHDSFALFISRYDLIVGVAYHRLD